MMTSKNYLAVLCCRVVAIVLCLCLTTGCTTFKPLETKEPQTIMEEIKPGDELILTTRDGRIRELKVKEATAQQLVGESEVVNLSDITNIERREFSVWKTGGLGFGIVSGVAITFLVIVLIAFAVNPPP
jgi:hypothetical protein